MPQEEPNILKVTTILAFLSIYKNNNTIMAPYSSNIRWRKNGTTLSNHQSARDLKYGQVHTKEASTK